MQRFILASPWVFGPDMWEDLARIIVSQLHFQGSISAALAIVGAGGSVLYNHAIWSIGGQGYWDPCLYLSTWLYLKRLLATLFNGG